MDAKVREKARDLARDYFRRGQLGIASPDTESAGFACAMEMAKWKDEQFAKILDEAYEMRKEICRNNVSFADCTELIHRLRKKLEE
jgi:hypothetical protein